MLAVKSIKINPKVWDTIAENARDNGSNPNREVVRLLTKRAKKIEKLKKLPS